MQKGETMTPCHAPRCHKEADVLIMVDGKRVGLCEKHWNQKCVKDEKKEREKWEAKQSQNSHV